jgi:hypothetical protein
MAKVKDGKIVKDEKKEKTNFLGGKKPFSIKKGKTLKQQRSDIIKGRSDRLKSDAKKQGISVDELKKKRSDTFSTVLSPLTLAPIGRGLSLAGKVGSKVSKFLKGSDKVKKSTKVADKAKNVKTSPSSTSGTKFSKKTTKNTKTNTKKTSNKKVTPTTVTKPKQGPFPKVYNRPAGPKPKTSTRIKNFVRKNKVPIIAGATALGTGTALLSGSKSNKDNKKVTLPKSRPKDKKPNIIKSKPINKTNITAGGNTGFGAKGNVFVSSEKRRKELMDKFGGTGSAAAKAAMRGTQGNMVKRAAGGLKPVPEGNKGLGKLPSPVRNKMGYMKKGGIVKMRGGGAATRGMNFNRGR